MAEQKRIDYTRAEQLGLLRRVILPATEIAEGKRKLTVTPGSLKAVLRAIDDHGRVCWASLDTLAAETGLSRRAVIRAVAALEERSVVCIEHRPKKNGGFRNEYRIVWTELDRLAPPTSTVPPGQTTVPPVQIPQCHGGTGSGRVKRNGSERVSRAMRFPDFRGLDLANPSDVFTAHQLLGAEDWDFEFVARCAAAAVRRARGQPHGLFVTMLDGPGEYETADMDTVAAKRTLRENSGHEVRT